MEKNKVMMIVIIVLLVVLLATIIGVSVFALKVIGSGGLGGGQTTVQYASNQLSPEQIEIISFERTVSTNLAKGGDGASHVIKFGIEIGVDNTDKKESPKFVELVKAKEVIIRDAAISIARSKTFEQLNRPDGKEILKEEILQELQNIFKDQLLTNVYISEFIVQ